MSGSVIVAGARTPIGRLLGGLKDFSGADLGGVAIKGGAGAGRGHRRPGRLRDHGPGPAGRRRADPRPPGRGQGRHPDDRPGAHDQQGLPVGLERDRAGRPADPRRRVRDRRRRRHGVDDQRAAPAAEVARGLQVRRRRRWSTRWRTTGCSTRSPTQADGRADRGVQRGAHEPHPRGAGRVRRRARTSGPRPPRRTASSTTRSCRSRSRSARATRSSSREDEGIRGDTTAESLGQAAPGVRARTARSPPAPPRRSPTAPRRSS